MILKKVCVFLALISCANQACSAPLPTIPAELLKLADTSAEAALVVGCRYRGCFNVYLGHGKEAIPWFNKAADMGLAAANTMLGRTYQSKFIIKEGLEQDYRLALKYFIKGYQAGDVMAAKGVGRLYKNGLGVIQNPVKAYSWYLVARAWGDKSKSVQKALVELEDKLEVEEKSTARAEAEKLYSSVERMDDRAIMLMFKRFPRN
jgi:hypothetical protein